MRIPDQKRDGPTKITGRVCSERMSDQKPKEELPKAGGGRFQREDPVKPGAKGMLGGVAREDKGRSERASPAVTWQYSPGKEGL